MTSLANLQIAQNTLNNPLQTDTTLQQKSIEEKCALVLMNDTIVAELGVLKRTQHIEFLRQTIGKLPGAFAALDASRPWMIYWSVNALCILGQDISDLKDYANETILQCLCPTGGIGGNVGQNPHLAPSYAGINTLAITGNEKTWNQIDKALFYNWLLKLKQPNGGFLMHEGGECDVRAVYCAMSIASLLGILDQRLAENVHVFIKNCQQFEGGFAGFPDTEAHGGYAFCALAALCIAYPVHEVKNYVDIPSFIRWLSVRQHNPEGGFSGRTNKLVDACYSHWVGGCWALLDGILDHTHEWDRAGLQRYTLYYSQVEGTGGLRDKPGKHPDAYHSNYSLSGLSGAQHRYFYDKEKAKNAKLGDYSFMWHGNLCDSIMVEDGNKVELINPVHVLSMGIPEKMNAFFKLQSSS